VSVRRVAGVGVCVFMVLIGGTVGSARAASVHRPVGYAGPARGIMHAGSGSLESRNWAGYAALPLTGTTDFNAVKSTWVEPAVTCEAASAWTVFWVGLDGWNSDTVEQGGSSAQCIGGVPNYTLWWEMYPTNAIQTMNGISPGDTISASVTYDPSTKLYRIKVKDVTSGQGFTKHEKCANNQTCSRASAEAIAEDVGRFGQGTYFPLADYGTMTFTNSTITDVNGTAGGFTKPAWQYAAITEQSGTRIYATISALSDRGKTFSATWKHR
jgi:hypothetical protein